MINQDISKDLERIKSIFRVFMPNATVLLHKVTNDTIHCAVKNADISIVSSLIKHIHFCKKDMNVSIDVWEYVEDDIKKEINKKNIIVFGEKK